MLKDVRAAKDNRADWKYQSQKLRCQLRMPQTSSPWVSQSALKNRMCARELDVLDICWTHRREKIGNRIAFQAARKNLWADPTQSVQRLPYGLKPPLLAQRTRPYSYEHDCLLSGQDAMRLQGFPAGAKYMPPHMFTDDQLRSLAGESYFIPNMAVLTYRYFLNPHAIWWQR